MKIELSDGEGVHITFAGTDGEFYVMYSDEGIVVTTDMEDPDGRCGEIFKDDFREICSDCGAEVEGHHACTNAESES